MCGVLRRDERTLWFAHVINWEDVECVGFEVNIDLKQRLRTNFVGREEIKGDRGDSVEIGSQREKERRLQQAKTEPGRPPDRSEVWPVDRHNVHRYGPVDRPVDRGKGTVERSGRQTDIGQLSVGPGWPGRSTEDKDRSTGRSTDKRILLSFLDSDSFSILASNPIRVSYISEALWL